MNKIPVDTTPCFCHDIACPYELTYVISRRQFVILATALNPTQTDTRPYMTPAHRKITEIYHKMTDRLHDPLRDSKSIHEHVCNALSLVHQMDSLIL